MICGERDTEGTRNRSLLRSLAAVAAGLLLAMLVGCTPPQVDVLPAPGTYAEAGSIREASIPGLDFVDPSSLEDVGAVSVGAELSEGSYEVLVAGAEISELRWDEDMGTGQRVLSLWLSPAASKRFEAWTREHIGATVPLVLKGRVIMLARIFGPIEKGAIALSLDDTQTAVTLDAAIVAE